MTELNYFSLIDVSNYSASAASVSAVTICYLYSAPALPTTSAAAPPLLLLLITASLSSSGTDRVFAYQIVGIKASVWFTKLVLEEQKKKKEKENNNNNKNDDDDDENNELVI
ncbi:hypothetical protein CIHG_10370 [Coccidioides immitis H538.4]|uniref:Uncharacterized protein n=1 Tax=Coccidioides immitis H538.4 TaxID=396776 RepID=A0A0J8S5J1_COCIT|nr:hypothetical protein CIHG_10370 [Coccidioides immitis H538.4]